MNPLLLRVLPALRVWIFSVLFLVCGQAQATRPVHYGLFGNVHVGAPAATPKRTVILFSGGKGWDARAEALAAALVEDGALVLGIDLPAYLGEMLSINDKCSLPSAHVEEMSHWMQREQKLAQYGAPVLAGDGAGATFAYAVAAQAPKGTFAALATLGWDFSFRLPKPLCPGDAGRMTAATAGERREGPAEVTDGREGPAAAAEGSYRIVPVRALPNAWLPLPVAPATADAPALAARAKSIEMYFLGVPATPAPGAGLPAAVDWLTAAAAAAPALPQDVADLPLVEVPVQATPVERIAIILTGDGGWAGLDIAVADQLARRGIAVVGLSSVKYFWQTRTPGEAAGALTRIIGHYGATRPLADFVVIGYSFGAALSPVLINRLPDAARTRVAAQVLISPDAEAVFEIHVGDWFGSTRHEGALAVLPEISATKVPVICVHGADEGADSFCPKLAGKPNVRDLQLPGGHHYNGDYDKLGASIYAALPRH
jgi:type IV secretory pathway VirJ component